MALDTVIRGTVALKNIQIEKIDIRYAYKYP
jgi:hypothetical protein